VLVGPHIEPSTLGGTECIDVQRQVSPQTYDSVLQAYDVTLYKLENHVTSPHFSPILVSSIESNPVNNEVSTVIGSAV
jgi:hypothetical protein